MNKEPVAILIDIIRTYLNLTNDQIWQYNQARVIPNTSGSFVVVSYEASKPYSTSRNYSIVGTNYLETTTLQAEEMYSIEIFSRDSSARLNKEQIILALASNYSIQQQELYNFRIASVAERINNISSQDGGSMLNRFVIDTRLITWYQNTQSVNYFNRYPTTQIGNS